MRQSLERIGTAWVATATTAGRAIIRIDCTSTKNGEPCVRLPHVKYTLEIISGGNSGHPAGDNRVFPLYYVKMDYIPSDPVKSAASLEYRYIDQVSNGEILESSADLNRILSDWYKKPSPWDCEQEAVITAPHQLAPTALLLAPLYGFAIGSMANRINDRHQGKGPEDLETAFERFAAFAYTSYRTWGLL